MWRSNKVNPKQKINKSDIFKILKYQNFFSSIILIAPYKISGSIGCRNISAVKNYNVLYILMCLIVSVLMLWSLYLFMHIGIGLRILQASLNTVCVIVLIFYTFFLKNKAVKMLKHFEVSEKFFQENGMKYSRKKFRMIVWFEYILILYLCLCSFSLLEIEYLQRHHLCTFPLFLWSNVLILFFLFQYINYILLLNEWLKNLARFIENLFDASVQEVEQKLFVCRIAYDEIFHLCKQIEHYYEVPLVFIQAGSFLNSTVYLYLWYTTTKVTFSTYFWFFFNLFKLLCTSIICEFCSTQDYAVRYALRKLAGLSFGKHFNKDNMHGLAMIMAEKKIVFELCGMFIMNREFVVSVIGAVTVYVVILQQNNVKSE